MNKPLASIVALSSGLTFVTAAHAADDTVAGAATSPHPTLHNLSISWPITGDDDGDGVVAVRFRKQGDASFREAAPLFRVPAGVNDATGITWENRHAGSVFGLEEATTYEVELTLTDPDGGSATQTVTATTRATPTPGPNEISVDPTSIDGAIAAAQPGDTLVLADGTYGEIIVTADGVDGAPVTLRAANETGAVVEGDVRLDGRSHVIVEGLTVRGKVKLNDAASIMLRRNHVETTEDGFVAFGTGAQDSLFTDNTITGATVWAEGSLGVDGDNVGEGIVVTGPGNVIAFNRVSGFRDCLSLLEDGEAVDQQSIDIYGNDLDVCADDAIEADFSMGNVRVYQNRIAQSFMGISSQPSLGGPTYFIRNAMYNVLFQAFKLQRTSVGDVLLHNSVVKSGDALSVNTDEPVSRAWSRNNLFVGGPGGTYNGYDSGPGDVITLRTADAACDLDYDAFGSIGTNTFTGHLGDVAFASLAELRSNTTEAHALEIDLSVFAAAVPYPADPFGAPSAPSLVLAAGSAPVDAGVALPGVNDGFTGSAPDLGAYEVGLEPPVYGPGGQLGTGGGSSGSGSGGGSSGEGPGSGAGAGDAVGAGGGSASGGPNGAGTGSSDGASADGAGGGEGATDGDDDGCGCTMVGESPRGALGGVALALAGAVALQRRRLRRS